VGWDVTCYADNLPKTLLRPGTRASDEKEELLKKWYPSLEGVTASKPSIIVNMHGVIVAWYLPGILSNSRRVCSFSVSNHIENLTHLRMQCGKHKQSCAHCWKCLKVATFGRLSGVNFSLERCYGLLCWDCCLSYVNPYDTSRIEAVW